ncbi:MAG: response regulator [Pirellulales bacterium]
MQTKNSPPVLLIEDSLDDIEFTRRAFAKCEVANPLVVVEEGEEALSLLTGGCPHDFGPGPLQPALILLDLNLPGLSGHAVLKTLKSDPALRKIPVAVLTTSTDHRDVDACYRNGVNSYHRKPDDLRQYQDTLRTLAGYWLASVVLPN